MPILRPALDRVPELDQEHRRAQGRVEEQEQGMVAELGEVQGRN